MIRRSRLSIPAGLVVVGGVAAAGIAMLRHAHGAARPRHVAGGILMADTSVYDPATRVLLGSFFRGIAKDIAAAVPVGARVLEVGSGPGHLSIELVRRGLDVTGIDLDPSMIDRAAANAAREPDSIERRPAFAVADVASLPFDDASFDVVVSTLSMHHWDDPHLALTEIARVLRPDGRALIWDVREGRVPLHRNAPDPAAVATASPMRLISSRPWRWPWRLSFTERIELAPTAAEPAANA